MPEGNEGETTPKNDLATMRHEEVVRTALTLQEVVKARDAEIAKLTQLLKQASDVLEGDLKARKVNTILKFTDYTVEDVDKMSIKEMDRVEEVIRMTKKSFMPVAAEGDKPKPSMALDGLYAPWRNK
jgi:NADH/NAD ratio-sensing transcriptional regulator Rex